MKRAVVDGKKKSSSRPIQTVQSRSFTEHRGSKWLNLLEHDGELQILNYSEAPLAWTDIKAPLGAMAPNLESPRLDIILEPTRMRWPSG